MQTIASVSPQNVYRQCLKDWRKLSKRPARFRGGWCKSLEGEGAACRSTFLWVATAEEHRVESVLLRPEVGQFTMRLDARFREPPFLWNITVAAETQRIVAYA